MKIVFSMLDRLQTLYHRSIPKVSNDECQYVFCLTFDKFIQQVFPRLKLASTFHMPLPTQRWNYGVRKSWLSAPTPLCTKVPYSIKHNCFKVRGLSQRTSSPSF